jgi:hypothetical protein
MTTRREFLQATVAAPILPALATAAANPEPAPAPVSDERVRELVDRMHEGSDDPEQAAINALYSRIVHGIRSLLKDVREARASDWLPDGIDKDYPEEKLEFDLTGLEYNLMVPDSFIPGGLAWHVIYPKDCPCEECREHHRLMAKYAKEALERPA